MVDISSQNNKINVTVSSSGNTANTNVTPDYAQYYSEKSKEWAISNRIIDNTDYSSKYYANESKKQADISTAKATEVITSGNTAVSNIENARDNAIINVNTAGATQVALATEQATIATNKTSEVIASGNTALANIDTAKNSAITSITTQETTSKNNVIATGNEQVERVNLTGVDNRTPIFTKSEIGTNEGVYQNVYDLKHSTFDKSKFTVVGSPTITDDGVASGFSTSNYFRVPQGVFSSSSKPFKFIIQFTWVKLEGTPQALFQITGTSGWFNYMYIGTSSVTMPLEFSDSSHQTLSVTNLNIDSGNTYRAVFEWTGNSYTLSVYNSENSLIARNSIESSLVLNSVSSSTIINIGRDSHSNYYSRGSIDLKQFSITVDGKEVFNGNKTGLDVINEIEIPYTLSKTGSKIVDVAYRDRVIDLYEQEGKAGYYTIDEENKNFTLPMGEVYGMIEGKADKDMLNNPYSLFDSKYSDHELNNLSWLKSAGQWNAKAVYPTAYDKLLKVYNGTETVEGLSVKLSTETYTDYDFVLKTADETFRLPLKTNLASGKAVVGNGMTLGFTNGTYNFGLAVNGSSGNSDTFLASAYGEPVGTIGAHSVETPNWSSMGVTTDPTKSGLELSDSGLYLYFYIGETVQNANLIDAGRIGEQLATKTDMLQASSAGMPSNKYIDLTLGASGSTYTAPANGFITICKTANGNQYVTLRNTTNGLFVFSGGISSNWVACTIPCKKSDNIYVEYNTSGTTNMFRFIYAEGENN